MSEVIINPTIQGDLFDNDYPVPQKNTLRQKKITTSNKATKNKKLLTVFIDTSKPLCRLTYQVDWQEISDTFGKYFIFSDKKIPMQKMAGLYFLKKQSLLNDYSLLNLWLENPYWQFFTGEIYFQKEIDITPEIFSAFVYFVGQAGELYLNNIANKHELLKNPLHPEPIFSSAKKLSSQRIVKIEKQEDIYHQPLKWYQDHLFYIYILIAIAFWVLYSFIFPTSWPSELPNQNQLKHLFFIVLAYPILEEIAFRYGLQGWFHRFEWGKMNSFGISSANICSSLIFSILHIAIKPEGDLTYALVIPSLIFGYFRDRHGHIWSCSILHIFYNLGIFVLVILPKIS